ncbi:MAG: hypothetical protein D6696_14600, partial [Acidobacteria bacterium]
MAEKSAAEGAGPRLPAVAGPGPVSPALLAELAGLTGEGERRAFFDAHPQLIDPALADALCAEALRLTGGVDPERAVALADAARVVAAALDDPRRRALAA